jgi:hypothetical protein
VRFEDPFAIPVLIDGRTEVQRLDFVIEVVGRRLEELSSDGALDHLRKVINERRTIERAGRRSDRVHAVRGRRGHRQSLDDDGTRADRRNRAAA